MIKLRLLAYLLKSDNVDGVFIALILCRSRSLAINLAEKYELWTKDPKRTLTRRADFRGLPLRLAYL